LEFAAYELPNALNIVKFPLNLDSEMGAISTWQLIELCVDGSPGPGHEVMTHILQVRPGYIDFIRLGSFGGKCRELAYRSYAGF
jgi:hypothetical protein